MAKPDCDDGFFKLAYELVAGLADTPALVGLRSVALFEVWAQQYGWAKREWAVISPTEIAERRGLKNPKHVIRALTELVNFKVLEKDDEGRYRFVKDYERYDFRETKEERRARLSYAAHAPVLVKSYRLGKSPNGSTPTPPSGTRTGTGDIPEMVPEQSSDIPEMGAEGTRNGSTDIPEMVPGALAPNRSACVGENSGEEEKAADSSRDAEREPEADPGAEARARRKADLIATCELNSGDDDPGRAHRRATAIVNGHVAEYGLYPTEAAVRETLNSEYKSFFPYLASVLRDWKKNGKLPKEPPPRPRQETYEELMARVIHPAEMMRLYPEKLDPRIWSREALMSVPVTGIAS